MGDHEVQMLEAWSSSFSRKVRIGVLAATMCVRMRHSTLMHVCCVTTCSRACRWWICLLLRCCGQLSVVHANISAPGCNFLRVLI